MQTISVQNPIVRAEFRHQRFVIERGRVGRLWILLAAALVIPSLLAAIFYTGVGLISVVQPDVALMFVDSSTLIIVLLVVMAISLYAVVTLITLALSANSIRREKDGHTWDHLRLTDLSARQIVWGKWWASLWALNGDHLMVAVLRVGVVAYATLYLLPWFAAGRGFGTVAFANYIPALILVTLIYSAFDAALTAAMGILAAVPDETAGTISASFILSLRAFTIALAGAWLLFSLDKFTYLDITAFWQMTAVGLLAYGVALVITLFTAERLVN